MARTKNEIPGGTRVSDLVTMGVLAERFPRGVVSTAVRDAGRASVRRRELPAELVVLFCVSLWLYRDVSYEDVLDCLLEAWRWLGLPGSDGVTKGAISQARGRLGEEPMKLLFERVAVPLATPQTPGAWYRGRRLTAVDGTLFNTPDTPLNAEAFGRPSNQVRKGPFPQVRVIALVETSTHAPFGCAIGAYTDSEVSLLGKILDKLEPDMLLLADRGFFGPDVWTDCAKTGAMLLWRIQKNAPVDVLDPLSDGSYRGRVRWDGPETPLRVIGYRVEGSEEPIRLVTNILDPAEAPAIELAGLYPERWEAELCFDEIKSHVNESRLALRSKKPDLAKQEIWGLMLLHWALRQLMHEAARSHARDPDTISFVRTVRLVKTHLAKDGSFPP